MFPPPPLGKPLLHPLVCRPYSRNVKPIAYIPSFNLPDSSRPCSCASLLPLPASSSTTSPVCTDRTSIPQAPHTRYLTARGTPRGFALLARPQISNQLKAQTPLLRCPPPCPSLRVSHPPFSSVFTSRPKSFSHPALSETRCVSSSVIVASALLASLPSPLVSARAPGHRNTFPASTRAYSLPRRYALPQLHDRSAMLSDLHDC